MKITQIRNATLHIVYKNRKFLIDPWLGPKEYMPGFEMAYNPQVRQPRTELPLPVPEIAQADAVILTHFHPDHWDQYAADALAKNVPFFVQSETDKKIIEELGFTQVYTLAESGTDFEGVTLHKTPTQHGRRETVKAACEAYGLPYDAMGTVFTAAGEETLYLVGDSIWCEEVQKTIDAYKPQVIIINACGARITNGERLIMVQEDVKAVCAYAPKAQIIASHMDTVSHLTVTREDLRTLHLPNLLIPADGETLFF